ncbi:MULTISPECIES: hypothetical protein [unclassified Synechococcus]|uniref:hypothetical protein n=1 Tax=unclassified Synechococcus TaxID=2626047 RepID=UPI001CF80099|nr:MULTISPECIES: hypothetical protein [unclassified Synechococcus]
MVMDWKGCLLPLAFPLSVLVIGSWRLAVSDRSPAPSPASFQSSQDPALDYTQAPPGTYPTCQDDPALADLLLAEGSRLGIVVKAGLPELPGKDASYRAESGRLGTITIKQRPMSPLVRCMLVSHEFIHVLQHLHGDLRGVPPLGWTTEHPDPIPQEAEAYGHQQRAGYVLRLLQQTERP